MFGGERIIKQPPGYHRLEACLLYTSEAVKKRKLGDRGSPETKLNNKV